LTGSSLGLQLIYNHSWNQLVTGLILGYWVESNRNYNTGSGLLPTDYHSPGIGLNFYYPLSDRLSVVFNPNFYWQYYPTLEQPDGINRIDHLKVFNFRLSDRVGDRTTIFASVQASFNQSSLTAGSVEDRNYTQIKSVLGLSWDMTL
jgi:hypothetical protein